MLFLVVSVVPLVNPTLTPFSLELYSRLCYNLIDKAKIDGEKMYKHKEKYTIDFTDVKNFLEMHFVIKEALDFPDYYGCNWSALWDSLTDMYGEPIHIEILGLENIKNRFGEETVDKMIEIFKRFKHFEKSFENDIEIEISLGKTKTTIA